MRQTSNYSLSLPEYNDVADIEIINGNFDKIDTELGEKANLSDLENKVDKQPGKSLSSNDFTDEEKQKLSNLPNQAELNIKLDTKIDKTDIVNDLISGGSTKVLSAEQGKVLFQSVVNGKQSIATAINDIAGSNVANKDMTHADLGVSLRNTVKSKSMKILLNLTGISNYRTIYIPWHSGIDSYPIEYTTSKGLKVTRAKLARCNMALFTTPLTSSDKWIWIHWQSPAIYTMIGYFFRRSKLPSPEAVVTNYGEMSLNGNDYFQPTIKNNNENVSIIAVPSSSEDLFFGIGVVGYNGEATESAYIKSIVVLDPNKGILAE